MPSPTERRHLQNMRNPAPAPGVSTGGNTGGNGGGGGGNTGGGHPPPSPGLPESTGTAINGSPAIDLFSTASNYLTRKQPAGQNYMTSYYIREYNAMRFDLYFNDLSGGIDGQVRRISDGVFTNELAASYLNATHSRTMILAPYVTSDSGSTNSIGTLEAMSACYLNDGGTPRWLVAAGDTANKCLFALTTSVTAQTYTPSSNIISLTTVKIATNTERVIVGRAGAAAQVLTGFNGSPTTSGTMHANTAACWGVIRSPLNSTTPGAETLLMYCGGSGATLYSLSSTAAIGDAPTAVLTNWPSGGYALGRATLWNEGVERAYWVHPLNSSSTSMLDSSTPGKIVSTNLEGSDPKELVIPGLSFIKHAMLWRGGIVATDGRSVVWINSDTTINLGWNRERRWESYNGGNSTFGFGVVQSLAVIGDRLLVSAATITASTQDVARPTIWEEYLIENDTWQFFARNAPLHDSLILSVTSSVLPNISLFTGQTPVYQPHDTAVDNGIFYWYLKDGDNAGNFTYKWQSVPLLASGINPNFQQSESDYVTYAFDDDSLYGENYAITPEYHLWGMPMTVSDIQFSGTLKGEDSSVQIIPAVQTASSMSFANSASGYVPQTATFKEDTDWRKRWWINPNPRDGITDRLQFMIIIKRGTSGSQVSKATPNALPFRVGGYVYLDGIYKDPQVMEPNRFWGGIK